MAGLNDVDLIFSEFEPLNYRDNDDYVRIVSQQN